jgi:hypothetical protein
MKLILMFPLALCILSCSSRKEEEQREDNFVNTSEAYEGWFNYAYDSTWPHRSKALLPGKWVGSFKDFFGLDIRLELQFDVHDTTFSGTYTASGAAVDVPFRYKGNLHGSYVGTNVRFEFNYFRTDSLPIKAVFKGVWRQTNNDSSQAMIGTTYAFDQPQGVWVLYRYAQIKR